MKTAKNLERLGTESAFKILAEAKKLEADGKKIIHLSLGQPDFKSPKHVVDATKKALDDGHHGYVLPNGIIECREAVNRKIKKLYNTDIEPERIIIMPGGKPTIYYAITLFGEPGAEIIYPDPGFPIYESMINYTGAKAVPINMLENKDLSINPEKILSLINEKTRLIIINNPNNPTGSFMNEEKINELVNFLDQFPNLHILSDEIYSKIIFNHLKMPSFIRYKNILNRLIVLDGWSKTYCMTGWRLGWSIWPKKYIDFANKLCVNNHSCPTSISQYAGIEALNGSQNEINKIVQEFQKRRDFVYKEINKLENISCFEPGGAFYAFPNISKTGFNDKEFANYALEKKGVAIVPGTSFGDQANKNIRISFANSLEKIEEAIKRISTI